MSGSGRHDPQHQDLREMLGAYALGHLGDAEADRVRAHLDGCPTCRAELAEIEPLAALLDGLEAEWFEDAPTPPAGLGRLIRDQIAVERAAQADELATRRRRRRMGPAVAAAVALVAVGAGGVAVGRSLAPESPTVPRETVALVAGGPEADIRISDAFLVNHTWGTELRFEATGFDTGRTYEAAFRSEDGTLAPAGAFLGVGAAAMTCNLQSSLLRDQVVSVVITDEEGRTVAAADL